MNMNFNVWAHPWWVNLAILAPIATYFLLRRNRPSLGTSQLLITAAFGIGFGFVEGSVVVYLRAITGFVLGSSLAEVVNLSSQHYQEAKIVSNFPTALLKIEVVREAATILMLGTVAALAVRGMKERLVMFLWAFAVWDISYYLALRLMVGWPASLLTTDVLFLIPTPWISQVWFPLLVSGLTLLAIILVRKRP